MQRIGRRALKAVAWAVALLVVLELGATAIGTLWLDVDRELARAERETFLRQIPGQTGPGSKGDAWTSAHELHPYFGFVLDRRGPHANNQGFQSPFDYPYEKFPWEYVIGVYGGSVAQQIVTHPGHLIEAIRPHLLEHGYLKVTVLMFAQGAGKQPATFNILAQHIDSIDMAIVLDGLNDIFQSEAQIPDYPASFPTEAYYRPLADPERSPYAGRDTALLSLANDRAADLTHSFDRPLLRHSLLAHLAWRALMRDYEAEAAPLRARLHTSGEDYWRGIDPEDDDRSDSSRSAHDRYLDLYEDLTHYGHLIAESKGKLYFHFVQPNQYVAASKPFSEEEDQRFRTAYPDDFHGERYARLETISASLRERGVRSEPLTHVFAEEERTVYSDDCCHFNHLGVQLLSEAIGETVVRSGLLAGVEEAGEPTEPFPTEILGIDRRADDPPPSRYLTGVDPFGWVGDTPVRVFLQSASIGEPTVHVCLQRSSDRSRPVALRLTRSSQADEAAASRTIDGLIEELGQSPAGTREFVALILPARLSLLTARLVSVSGRSTHSNLTCSGR